MDREEYLKAMYNLLEEAIVVISERIAAIRSIDSHDLRRYSEIVTLLRQIKHAKERKL